MAYVFGSIWDRFNRNALNDLSKSVEQQGKSIQDLVAEGQLTPTQYATLIQVINGLISKGDVSVQDIDLNKGKIDASFLSSELLSMIAGDSPVLSIVSPYSITNDKLVGKSVSSDKTDFVKITSDNLFNKENIIENSRISPSGAVIGYSNGSLSHFIPVMGGKKYAMHRVFQYAFYDWEQRFISLHDASIEEFITAPGGTRYMRLIIINTNLNIAQINEGTNLMPYDKYSIGLIGQSIELDDFSESLRVEMQGLLDVMTEENEEWVV